MLIQEEAVEISVLLKQGMGVREVARRCGVARNTVRRVRDEGSERRYRRPARTGKLEPFKAYLAERVAAARPQWIPASVLLREIRARGYSGSHTILRDHLRTLKPARRVDPVVRFETAPGVQMQLDWAEFRLGRLRWYLFVAVLGFSRWMWGCFADNQRFEALRDLHVEALLAMGGVPLEVLYDNMSTVVLERNADGPGQHRFHPGMSALARDYGFRLRLCRPYRAKTKGKVERVIGYIRGSFFVPLMAELKANGVVPTIDLVNTRFAAWRAEVANARVHATTRAVPAERLVLEQQHLQRLPELAVATSAREHLVGVAPPPLRPATPLQRPLACYEAYSAGVSA
jgi:transposase